MKYIKEEHFIVERTEIRGNRSVRAGKFYCILNDKIYNTLGGLRTALRHYMSVKDYYIRYYQW